MEFTMQLNIKKERIIFIFFLKYHVPSFKLLLPRFRISEASSQTLKGSYLQQLSSPHFTFSSPKPVLSHRSRDADAFYQARK
jgi:hypothetical protein